MCGADVISNLWASFGEDDGTALVEDKHVPNDRRLAHGQDRSPDWRILERDAGHLASLRSPAQPRLALPSVGDSLTARSKVGISSKLSLIHI